ncbi:ABC transporter permease [Aeromicrobium sp.]|uniref:ABC transporter permease n=1 Tax=Aeromicrobium sp. TaxID=1871063 RepID=UPI0019924998|nr:ABC transporter permease [Aeromicrobium sp.]MBC7633124.1 ABC transporter permease subunit [Aeromicrobium sp.]
MSTTAIATIDTTKDPIPLLRVVKVELRKMFDTRSGAWLMASIGIVALIATVGVILIANDSDLGFGLFGAAVGFPMTILLPIVAILSVTGEWSQRTGLITFTLLPHRGQVIVAKAIAAVLVAIVSMLLAFAIGALGNIIGSAIAGVDAVWDMKVSDMLLIILGNIFGLLVGFMLGVLIRNSAGAIVAYFVYSFVLPSIFAVLAGFQDWFQNLRPWIDFNFSQTPLFDGGPSGEEWAHLGTSGLIWFVIPLALGVWAVLRSEVK